MGGKSKAPAPDPNIGIAALKNAELGEEWLGVSREQFAIANERQKPLDELSKRVTEQQLTASEQAQQWATEDRDRYKTVFEPLQNEFIDTAKNWDSAERQDKLAAEARADVVNNAALQRQQRERQMAGMGVNPTSGRFAGIESAEDTKTALAAAGAENSARNTVRKEGVAMQADAVNMGNGLAVNPATSLGLGVQSGTSAAGTTAAANAAASNNLGILRDGYSTAMKGYSNQANILQNQYNSQLQAWNTQQQANSQGISGLASGIGTLAGMAIMKSDKNAKKDKKPARGVLETLQDMPVEEWTYKEGEGDGESHIGPYAQDFQKATGKGDGKTINVIDAIGVTMGAVQELDRKVDQLAAGKGRGLKPGKGREKPRGRGIFRDEGARA